MRYSVFTLFIRVMFCCAYLYSVCDILYTEIVLKCSEDE